MAVKPNPTEQVNPKFANRGIRLLTIWDKNDSRYSAMELGARTAVHSMAHNTQIKIETETLSYDSEASLLDALKQVSDKRFDALILEVPPELSGASLAAIKQTNIPLFTTVNDVSAPSRIYFSGVPEEVLGIRLGHEIGLRNPGKDAIVIVQFPGEEKLSEATVTALRKSELQSKIVKLPESISQSELIKLILGSPSKNWVLFQNKRLNDHADLPELLAAKKIIYTLGCEPEQLNLLKSGVLQSLTLPSYECSYSATYRAVDYLAYGHKSASVPLTTPFVTSKTRNSWPSCSSVGAMKTSPMSILPA